MSLNNVGSLENAKKQFADLMNILTKSDRQKLLVYGIEEWMTIKMGDESGSDSDNEDYEHDNDNLIDDPAKMLNLIAKDLRQKLPFTGATTIRDSDVVNALDAFLYEEEDFEELREQKKLELFYCRDCQSRNIEPIKIISQSLSREDLYQVFNNSLPTLDGKVVLDVASRIGASLYGAFVYTDAEKIIGLELKEDLVELQKNVINKYKMEKRVEIINKSIKETPEILRGADVILLLNLAEDYTSESEQAEIWKFLKENIKKDTYIVLGHSLESYLEDLDVNIDINNWVKRADLEQMGGNGLLNEESDDDDRCRILCYQVL